MFLSWTYKLYKKIASILSKETPKETPMIRQ